MPFIKIEMWEGRDSETKGKLIENVSKTVSESLDIPLEWINVCINEIPKENWGIKGEQASKKY